MEDLATIAKTSTWASNSNAMTEFLNALPPQPTPTHREPPANGHEYTDQELWDHTKKLLVTGEINPATHKIIIHKKNDWLVHELAGSGWQIIVNTWIDENAIIFMQKTRG